MAKKGEIDPWNIDVVELADKFLEKVRDLRTSARILFYASVLLKMKAKILIDEALGRKKIEDEFKEEEFHDFYEPKLEPIVTPFKRDLKRFVTLQELIKELRRIEKSVRRRRRGITIKEDYLDIHHEEDIERDVNEVFRILKEMFRYRSILSFFEIIRGLRRDKVISYYMSILYLCQRGKIKIIQLRPYDDIRIECGGG